jgi:hypothetical protein
MWKEAGVPCFLHSCGGTEEDHELSQYSCCPFSGSYRTPQSIKSKTHLKEIYKHSDVEFEETLEEVVTRSRFEKCSSRIGFHSVTTPSVCSILCCVASLFARETVRN